jgi:NAD(P)-dependent dehydrogenase (short-subunit alcohol dehydrogenase family)
MTDGRKSVLILGGNASLASKIIELIDRNQYQITCTFRKDKPQGHQDFIHWKYLDLENRESIESLLSEIENQRFERIFSFLGEVINSPIQELSYLSILQYHTSHTVNYLYLLTKLAPFLKHGGNMVVMSSRAANNPSYSIHYAATKAALEAYVRCSAMFMGEGTSIVAISSGLIEGSQMSIDMAPEIRDSHRNRARGSLLTREEFAEILWSHTPDLTRAMNGQTIQIGPQY